jgi:tetratricopeptide (TPR) repeat protein
VFVPGEVAKTADGNVSLADLAGTLLQAAGVPVPDGMRKGPLANGGDVYAETVYPRAAGWHPLSVIVFDQWKAVLSSEAELYDLRADPAERHDLAGEKLTTLDEARRRIAEVARAADAPIDDAAPNPARGIAAWNTFERMQARLAGGNARSALPELTRLARQYPDAPVFQAAYARALKDTGRTVAALDLYRRFVSRWPRDPAMSHDLATAALAAGMIEEAVRAEQASLALQPSNAEASNGLGLLLLDRGSTADAVRAFERATQDDPSDAAFWTNLGNARRAAGDLTRAEQAYRQALDLDPPSADAANGLGVLLVQEQRAAEAIAWFERALAGSPRFAEARLNLGKAYQETGHKDRAIEAYTRVLADAPQGSREYAAASQLLAAIVG